MIKGFKDKDAEELYNSGHNIKYKAFERIALRKLDMIEAASKLTDLKAPPGNHLELLFGNRKGQHSIRINDQFRICFIWNDAGAYDIEIVDYH